MPILSCPHCAKRLKVGDDLSHSKLRCPGCSTTFTAPHLVEAGDTEPVSRRKRRASKPSNPIPAVLAVLALLGVGLVFLFSGGGSGPTDPTPPPPRVAASPPVKRSDSASTVSMVDAAEHPAARSLRFLAQGIRHSNHPAALRQIDLQHWRTSIAPEDTRIWELLPEAEQATFKETILETLMHEYGLADYAQGEIAHVNYRDAQPFDLGLSIQLQESPDTTWNAAFHNREGTWLLAGFRKIDAEAPSEESAKTQPGTTQEPPKGPYVEIGGGGRVFAATMQRVAIPSGTDIPGLEALIEVALQEAGLESKLAKKELAGLAPAPIPLLLNRLVDTPLDGTEDQLSEAAAIDHLLQAISHRTSTLPMRALGTGSADDLLERQKAILASWFGWWKMWKNRWPDWLKKQGVSATNERGAGRTRGR